MKRILYISTWAAHIYILYEISIGYQKHSGCQVHIAKNSFSVFSSFINNIQTIISKEVITHLFLQPFFTIKSLNSLEHSLPAPVLKSLRSQYIEFQDIHLLRSYSQVSTLLVSLYLFCILQYIVNGLNNKILA